MAKGRERKAKWYFRNEEEVMESLGLEPTKGSGSGWLEKEDGQNDFVIAQLKSTDKNSFKLNQLDLEKLEYNAGVSGKIPMFLLQFLNKDSRYAIVDIMDIPELAKYIETGETEEQQEGFDWAEEEQPEITKKIKSSKSSRDKFYKDKEKYWEQMKYKKQ